MDSNNYISISEFCSCYEIDNSFIRSLNEYGLVHLHTIKESQFLEREQLREVEKMMRLHYDLKINLEGIDAISHLLRKVDSLQNEVRILQNKLRRYEE